MLNRVDDATERAVLDHAIEFPAHGQARTSNELRKKGVFYIAKWRAFYKLIRILNIQTASNDHALIDALGVVLSNANNRQESFANNELDMSFTSEKWKNLIYADSERTSFSRRYFEMAVFFLSCR